MKLSHSCHERKKLTPETLIKRDVKRYLSMTGWFCFSVLQGLGAHKGIPDIIACRNGQVLFIECKTAKGRQSPYQVEFQHRLTESGCNYLIVRSIDDIIDFQKKTDE